MGSEVYAAIVTGLLAVFLAFASRQAYLNKRVGDKASAEGAAIGAKTPAEIESISVMTMAKALESANRRANEAEERERRALAERDLARAEEARAKKEHRDEMEALEERFAALQREMHALSMELTRYRERFTDED